MWAYSSRMATSSSGRLTLSFILQYYPGTTSGPQGNRTSRLAQRAVKFDVQGPSSQSRVVRTSRQASLGRKNAFLILRYGRVPRPMSSMSERRSLLELGRVRRPSTFVTLEQGTKPGPTGLLRISLKLILCCSGSVSATSAAIISARVSPTRTCPTGR